MYPRFRLRCLSPPVGSRCFCSISFGAGLARLPSLGSFGALFSSRSFLPNRQGVERAERSEASEASLTSFLPNRQGTFYSTFQTLSKSCLNILSSRQGAEQAAERSEASEAPFYPCQASLQINSTPSEPSEASRARRPFVLFKPSSLFGIEAGTHTRIHILLYLFAQRAVRRPGPKRSIDKWKSETIAK